MQIGFNVGVIALIWTWPLSWLNVLCVRWLHAYPAAVWVPVVLLRSMLLLLGGLAFITGVAEWTSRTVRPEYNRARSITQMQMFTEKLWSVPGALAVAGAALYTWGWYEAALLLVCLSPVAAFHFCVCIGEEEKKKKKKRGGGEEEEKEEEGRKEGRA